MVRQTAATDEGAGGSPAGEPRPEAYRRGEAARRIRRRARRLMWGVLILWGLFGFGAPWVAETLNVLTIAGFPFGYYMAAQGTPIAFVILLFVFARRRNALEQAEADFLREDKPPSA